MPMDTKLKTVRKGVDLVLEERITDTNLLIKFVVEPTVQVI